MLEQDIALATLREFEEMSERRSTRDNIWQDIRELVRPSTSDFNGRQVSGAIRTHNAYDATAIDAGKELAAGLHSYLTNPSERFFALGIHGFTPDQYDEEGLAWLENAADIIYGEYNRPESGFHTGMHECFLDIPAFGTSNLYQEYSTKKMALTFRSFPVSDSYFREDSEGLIDTVYRRVCWSRRNVEQEFESLPPKMRDEKNPNKEFVVVHAVHPRLDRIPGLFASTNMKFTSDWVCQDTKEMIERSGYQELPYHPARWEKLAGEVYGEGPASTCLPDILMLNAMERTIIRAGQKRVDPPLIICDEGYTLPIATSPGSIIWKEPGVDPPESLENKGDMPWAEEKANQKRENIRKCFHADWLRMEKENKEMTAYEVSDRRNEKLGLLAPNLGRIQGEQLGPMIARSYNLLHRRGAFPPAPQSLAKRKLKVEYISPAARAQMAIKANEASRYVQELITIAAVKPEVLDYVDFDLFAKKLAEYRSVSRNILRPSSEVEELRAKNEQAAQLQQTLAAAEPASKALKNVADAQSKGLNLQGLM